MVIEGKGPVTWLWRFTGGGKRPGSEVKYVNPDDRDSILTDKFQVWYDPACKDDAMAAQSLLARQYELIAKTTGLGPVKWGIIVIGEKHENTTHIVPETGTGSSVWCYSRSEISGGHFARVNTHEWTEGTIGRHLRLYEVDPRNRFIGDGLAEYVAFLHVGVSDDYLAPLETLHASGVRSVNLLKEFRAFPSSSPPPHKPR